MLKNQVTEASNKSQFEKLHDGHVTNGAKSSKNQAKQPQYG